MKLRAIIGDDAFWVPPRLWAYAAENQPDGDLSGYGNELAMLIGCDKHASSMLQALKDSGFVDADCRIHDWQEHNGYHEAYATRAKIAAAARWAKKKAPQTPKEEKEMEKEIGDKHCSKHCSKHSTSIAWSIIEYLNSLSGRSFRQTDTNVKLISARLAETGVTPDGVKKMMERQAKKWKGTTMSEYLRPETLFNKTKFDSYYAAKDSPIETTPPGVPAKKINPQLF